MDYIKRGRKEIGVKDFILKLGVGVIFFIVVVIIPFLLSEIEQYKRSYNDLHALYEKQVEDSNKVLNKWKSDYEDLEGKYADLLVKSKSVELPFYSYSEEEIQILAKCVEAEAGEENFNAQECITKVILNRVKSSQFPNSISEVIYQRRGKIPQFSVAYNGMMNREVKKSTLSSVYKVLVNGSDLPDYVYYFYDKSVKGNWVNTLEVHDIVEGTVFAYKKEDRLDD